MSRLNWYTERRTKASIANGGNNAMSATTGTDETSTLSGGQRTTRRAFLSDEIEEDSDDDDEIDDDLPGAYAISRSTDGDIMEWDPTEQTQPPADMSGESEERRGEAAAADGIGVPEEGNNAPVAGKDAQPKGGIAMACSERKWLIALGVALCFAGVVVVAIVVVLVVSAKDEQQDLTQQIGTSPPVDVCEYADQNQVDPFIQCKCDQEITKVSFLVKDAYETIKAFLGDSFDKTLPMASCEPENMALVWISADYAEAAKDGKAMPMERVVTRYALAVMYYSWGGNDWIGRTNWLTSNNECVWFGIDCDENKVTNLTLSEENAGGAMDSRLALLSDLRILDLCNTQLTGSIPLEVWSLPNLEVLLLDDNDIDGTLPPSLGEYSTSLETISLYDSRLSGPLPSLSGMTQLRELNLARTQQNGGSLSGTIPESWGELVQLERLSIARNREITGSLPLSFSSLTNLNTLIIDGTGITGTIPEFIAEMKSLEVLSAKYTLDAASTIPTFLGSLTNLVEIGLSSCALTGTIPPELALCTNLENLWLGNNKLTGTLPPELGDLTNLKLFGLAYNRGIYGMVPTEYGELEELEILQLVDTELSGALPMEFCEKEFPTKITTLKGAFSNCWCCTEQCPVSGCEKG
mmetsp:Transcript_2285/g.3583  ORF Transcript_2285/g.3583 Transcript_2285/m.3583 type:complete len:637 (+) Transcript_2285:84-1994(+)